MNLLGFKKKGLDKPKVAEEPKRERLGDVLSRMNRAQRRSYMSKVRLHFKHKGMKIV